MGGKQLRRKSIELDSAIACTAKFYSYFVWLEPRPKNSGEF